MDRLEFENIIVETISSFTADIDAEIFDTLIHKNWNIAQDKTILLDQVKKEIKKELKKMFSYY